MTFRRYPADPQQDPDGTVVSALDWLGHRFAVGDKVLYCIGAGRGQVMALGEVTRIRSRVEHWRGQRPARDDETPDYFNMLTNPPLGFVRFKVPYDYVEVQVRTLRTSGRWDNGERQRTVYVNPGNITALAGLEDLR